MTSLVKRCDTESVGPVRSLRDRLAPPVPDRQPGSGADADESLQITGVDLEIASLRASIIDADARHAHALAEAHMAGKQEAAAAYAKSDARALALLGSAIDEAARKTQDQLAAAEALALVLAEGALEKIFGDVAKYRELVGAALGRLVAGLRREAVIAVHVSALDFHDENALRMLTQRSDVGRIEVRRDPQLAAGSCRIELRLGQVELSVPQHWDALKAMLRELADGPAKP